MFIIELYHDSRKINKLQHTNTMKYFAVIISYVEGKIVTWENICAIKFYINSSEGIFHIL